MERVDREILGTRLLEYCETKDVIDYFDVEVLLENIDDEDIADYVEMNGHILDDVDDDKLIEHVTFESSIIDSVDEDDMVEALTNKGYTVTSNEENENVEEEILTTIKNICRTIQPRGYISKEDAKQILCDYIDNWMIKSF